MKAIQTKPAAAALVLKEKVHSMLDTLERSALYAACREHSGNVPLMRAFLRRVYYSIYCYNPVTTRAVFAAVSRLPNVTVPDTEFSRRAIQVQLEELDHWQVALRSYLALGGDREAAINAKPPPAITAVSAMITHLGHSESAFCHLGFMYVFEYSTPPLLQKVAPLFAHALRGQGEAEFLTSHAEEDIRHGDMMAQLITEAESLYEGATEEILRGAECFLATYPLPIWEEAFRLAVKEVGVPELRSRWHAS